MTHIKLEIKKMLLNHPSIKILCESCRDFKHEYICTMENLTGFSIKAKCGGFVIIIKLTKGHRFVHTLPHAKTFLSYNVLACSARTECSLLTLVYFCGYHWLSLIIISLDF